MSDTLARRSADSWETATPRLLRGRAIGIVGLGQIGGSRLRGLSRHRPDVATYGYDTRPELSVAMRRYGSWCQGIEDIVDRCDVVVLSVPVHEIGRPLPMIGACAARRSGRRRLLVCDTGTVKTPVVRAADRWRAGFDFVGLHALAGGEGSGWEASDSRLFRGRPFVICPATKRPDALVRELIRLVGGVPLSMDPRTHDRVLATTIGAPHALAFAASGTLGNIARGSVLKGGSWASLTRVSASDPTMVGGFLHANAANQRRVIGRLRHALDLVDRALRARWPAQLQRLPTAWRAES